MTDFIESGDFSVDVEARTVRGLLLPFGELSKLTSSNTEPISVDRGSVAIPSDVSIITANRNHDKYDPVGRATRVEETDRGIEADFSIARTPEGDEFLEQHKSGVIRKLSAELTGIVRNGARGIAARLTGAAFVAQGAFESAALFSIGEVTEEETEEDLRARIAELEARLNAQTSEESDSEDNPETESDEPATTEKEGTEMAEAVVPNNDEKPADFSANKVFELVTAAKADDQNADFALADIKISGTGALPASGVLQPSWLGEVWAGVAPTRRYVNLVKGGSIVALTEQGFKLSTGSELVQSWAGNKAELPTGTATTSVVNGGPLQKWGFAADIAREFYDIPAGKPVVDAFIREIFYSYARVTDLWALQQIFAAAGEQVDAETYPTGYNSALGKLIQGVDTIDDSDIAPTFAIVAPDVYKALRYTPKDQIPEYVTFSAGRQSGTADGVTIVRDKSGTLAAGQVLVGGHDFAHINEIGGDSPIQLDAVDLAHGGLDKAVLGYQQYMTEYADGIVLIGDAE